MFWISGVWDPTIKHKVIGFAGIMILLGVAYVGSLVNGTPFFVRLIF